MNDSLGDRMKERYEDRTRYLLPRRTFTVIRVDGKAFHTLTKGFERPFDNDLMSIMDQTAISLCSGIQGAVMGYVQSDEISIVLTDFATPMTEAWFDGNVQKMVSISASIATQAFNKALATRSMDPEHLMSKGYEEKFLTKDGLKCGLFDSRVFTIPDPVEVQNYLIWRQEDASRNSIQMAAQALYSQKELHGKSCKALQELIFQKGINWNDYTTGEKRGRAVVKQEYPVFVDNPKRAKNNMEMSQIQVMRSKWVALTGKVGDETPIFSKDKSFLENLIPVPLGKKNDFLDR